MTKPQRYGVSSMPCDQGLYVLHKDYLALEAECEGLPAETDSLMKALADCREGAFDERFENPYLGGAVGDPLEVPDFVKWELDRLRAAAKEQA